MYNNPYKPTYYLLGILSLVTIIATIWAGNPPEAQFRIFPLLPWLPWTSSTYIALAGMLHISRNSKRASQIVMCSAMLIGAVNILLISAAVGHGERSGQLWMVVPLYELVGSVPLLIVVLLIKAFSKAGTPNQAL
jgi:hypothetical protein